MFVNNDTPSKYLQSFYLPGDIQAISIGINLKQRKLLVASIYRPPDQNLDYFLLSITGLLDHYLNSYEGFVIMGDFNATESNPTIETFLNQHKCTKINLFKVFGNSSNRSCRAQPRRCNYY